MPMGLGLWLWLVPVLDRQLLEVVLDENTKHRENDTGKISRWQFEAADIADAEDTGWATDEEPEDEEE